MDAPDDRLPEHVVHFAQSPRLHILRCRCGTEVEFDPKRFGEFERALKKIRVHSCPLKSS